MGRGMQIAVLGAALVGSTGGGLAALLSSPASPGPRPATRAAAQPPQPPAPAAPVPADPGALLTARITTVLERFADWARDHAGAPCPDLAALGVATADPWGHPIELTCTDQPADQIVGVTSAGPDGLRGNSDDVKSWTLGPAVTDLVHGARWKTAATAAAPPTAGTGRRRRGSAAAHDRPPPPANPPTTSVSSTTPGPQPTPSPAAPGPPPHNNRPGTPPTDGDDIPARR